jgi:hypothetical protein
VGYFQSKCWEGKIVPEVILNARNFRMKPTGAVPWQLHPIQSSQLRVFHRTGHWLCPLGNGDPLLAAPVPGPISEGNCLFSPSTHTSAEVPLGQAVSSFWNTEWSRGWEICLSELTRRQEFYKRCRCRVQLGKWNKTDCGLRRCCKRREQAWSLAELKERVRAEAPRLTGVSVVPPVHTVAEQFS